MYKVTLKYVSTYKGDNMTGEQIGKLNELGVNIDETLERFVNNEDLYVRCLHKLANDKNYGLLQEAIDEQDATKAFESAHALKGVTANLGLQYLFNELKEITEVFRAGSLDYNKDNLSRIIDEYSKAIDIINDL